MRRTFSDLFNKGIIGSRSVFGNSLVKLQEESQRDVPQFVKKGIEEIEHYLNEPMIYGLRIESETSMSIFYGRGLPITSLR